MHILQRLTVQFIFNIRNRVQVKKNSSRRRYVYCSCNTQPNSSSATATTDANRRLLSFCANGYNDTITRKALSEGPSITTDYVHRFCIKQCDVAHIICNVSMLLSCFQWRHFKFWPLQKSWAPCPGNVFGPIVLKFIFPQRQWTP